MLRVCACLLFVSTGLSAQGREEDPKADPRAVIIDGNVRFTMLTPRVIRCEMSPDAHFEDHASLRFINRHTPVPAFSVDRSDEYLEIHTEALHVRYRRGSTRFDSTTLLIRFQTGGMIGTWTPGLLNNKNLLGTTRTLDGYDGDLSTKDSTRLVLEQGLLSRDGWVVIDDSDQPIFDDSPFPWVEARNNLKGQDLYLFAYGLDYPRALKDFTLIAGRIALPPRWVFGYWFSRWRSFSDKELRELVGTFDALNLPLDVLVIDMDWHLTSLSEFFENGARKKDQAGESSGWTGFTWNRDYFPDPPGFLSWAKQQDLRISLNLHPASGIQPHEEAYPRMAAAMGIDTATRRWVPFNIVDKKFTEQYFKLILHPLERQGIDFWWLDWQQWNTTAIPGVNPTFYLNYVHYADMDRRGETRPLIYHRWGGLGNHRYQIGFSGDAKISWRSLAYQPYFTATAANVGFGYWGNDIGGFFGEPNPPEQYLRWFQFGTFSPILKTHATSRNAAILRKPWEYPPAIFLQIKELMHLRSSMIPYLYTNARTAYDEGISLVRPLYYLFPDQEEAYRRTDEYLFGDQMLVHPITRPISPDSGFVMQTTWLPAGIWCDRVDGSLIEGGKDVSRSYGLSEIPVFVKAGSIIPTSPPERRAASKQIEHAILTVYPGSNGEGTLYEDDGTTKSFKKGAFARTRFTSNRRKDRTVVTIEPAIGSFAGMPVKKKYTIRILQSYPPSSVTVNGKRVSPSGIEGNLNWRYDGEQLVTEITIPAFSVRRTLEVVLIAAGSPDRSMGGFKRKLDLLFELSKAISDLRSYRKQDVWNDAFYSSESVMAAMQTGMRMNNRYDVTTKEAAEFHVRWSEVRTMLEKISGTTSAFRTYLLRMNALEAEQSLYSDLQTKPQPK